MRRLKSNVEWCQSTEGARGGCPNGICAPLSVGPSSRLYSSEAFRIPRNNGAPFNERVVFHEERFSIGAIGAMADEAAPLKNGVGILG